MASQQLWFFVAIFLMLIIGMGVATSTNPSEEKDGADKQEKKEE